MTAVAASVAPDTSYWTMIKQAGAEWMEDKATKLAAALAYYTAFALAPLLVIAVTVATWLMRNDPGAKDKVIKGVTSVMVGIDPKTAETMVEAASKHGNGILSTVLAVALVLLGASGVFGELQDSLNTIWDVKPKPNQGIMATIKNRFLSMAMVMGVAFLMLVSLALSTFLSSANAWVLGDATIVARLIGPIVEFLVVTILFGAMFKVLPDVKVQWRFVILGAFLTAVLFTIGKYALSFYLTKSTTTSPFGAAGSLAAFLLWVYYSAQILFFGAEFTQVYARAHGEGFRPAENAEPITEGERAAQGIPSTKTGKPALAARVPEAPRPGEFRPLPMTSHVYNFHKRMPTDNRAAYVAAAGGLLAGLVGGACAAIAKKGTPRQMNMDLLRDRLRRIEAQAGRVSALDKRVEKVGVVERVNHLQDVINRAARNASRREALAHNDWRTRVAEYLKP